MSSHVYNSVLLSTPDPVKVAALHTNFLDDILNFFRKVLWDNGMWLPETVDLRSKCPPIYDQGGLGACTGFASAKGLREALGIMADRPVPEMSALFAYWNCRSAEHTIDRDAGATIVDSIAVLLHEGACPETFDPYHTEVFNHPPTKSAFTEAKPYVVRQAQHLRSLDELLGCLSAGYPAVGGIPVFDGDNGLESAAARATGMVGMPIVDASGALPKILGGHAILLVGFDAKTRMFIVRNSWGKDWGDKGYFYLPYEYIQKFADPLTSDWWTARL